MRTPLPTRRLMGSVPVALLAVVLVLLRLFAPAPSMAVAGPVSGAALDQFDRIARASICHVDEAGNPNGGVPAGQVDCLQCPACHLVAAAVVPVPGGPLVPAPLEAIVRFAASPPPATGPPGRVQGAAQPTGPPALSA